MGFWGSFLSSFKQIAVTLAIDTAALLLSGGSASPKPADLKDKAFRSTAYGSPWPRCRGVVRCQGKDLWGTQIYKSLWKTVSGGLFGIGSKSITYPKYSASRYIGFGKHLNGVAAISFLRIWADGKLLYNKQASTGKITGSVVVTTVGGGQLQGSQFIQMDVASGATVVINAGDLIQIPADPQPYTAQQTITANGPTTISVPVWPPLRVTLLGGGQVTIPPVSSSPYDLSSFDPNPHDGSHFNGGYPAPPGGISFYLGSDTQAQDPKMAKILGAANTPAYRGLVGIMIRDLQLVNYGDHFPAITAEIAYDVAAPLYPLIGPIDNTPLNPASLIPEFFALPFSGNAIVNFNNPLNALQYTWVFSQFGAGGGNDGTIYRINTQTNMVEQSVLVPSIGIFGLTAAGMVADADGKLYFIQNDNTLTKMDGFSLTVDATFSGFGAPVNTLYPWDTVQSLFGNGILLKLMRVGTMIFDRNILLPLGGASTLGSTLVVSAYDDKGNPIVAMGNPIQLIGLDIGNLATTDDGAGNIWISSVDNLYEVDCQFSSFIQLDQNLLPHPELILPTFSLNTVNISTLRGASSFTSIQYYSGDNTIVVFGGNKMGKVDCVTLAITQTVTGTITQSTKIGQADVMGTVIVVGAGAGTGFWERVDLSSLQIIAQYNWQNWFPMGTMIPLGGWPVFDPATDSVWLLADNNGLVVGGLNRLFLDRGNGNGIALDSIITSLMLEAGYQLSEFDVTRVIAAGLTCYGIEFERETFLDSLRKIMLHFQIDAAEIDGQIVFVPRGQASIVTIPEDDLGALDEPGKYEPRLFEILEDERDVPAKVTIKHYDPLKDSLQATQEFKRTLQAYPSILSTAKVDTNSRQELDIVSPITEFSLPVKQQAYKILWDAVAGRFQRKGKLPWKYIRYDPTDVGTLAYKGMLLETRFTEFDFGSGFAREFTGVSQDQSVYDASSVTVSSSGTGSGTGTGGTPLPPPNPPPLTYTVSPTFALSENSPTQVDMVQVTITWSDGRVAKYQARSFVTVDPGAGNSALYFVTILDANRTGDLNGSPDTAYCTLTPNGAFLGQPNYWFIGTITITHDLTGVVVTSGGSGNVSQAQGFYTNGSGGTGYSTQVDVVRYATMDARRATHHLAGSAANTPSNKFYSYVDNAINAFAFVKAAAGWANDILLWDNVSAAGSNPSGVPMIYHYITELDDVGYRLWTDPTSYKKNEDAHGYVRSPALPICPRFLTVGGAPGRVDFASPNNYGRYVSCSKIDTKNKGAFTAITYPPVSMNIDARGSSAGNLGNIQVVVNERYSGAKQRERFFWALDLGFVMWDAALLVSGTQNAGDPTWTPNGQYKIFNWSVHNQLVAGGGVASSFGCGWGAGWP